MYFQLKKQWLMNILWCSREHAGKQVRSRCYNLFPFTQQKVEDALRGVLTGKKVLAFCRKWGDDARKCKDLQTVQAPPDIHSHELQVEMASMNLFSSSHLIKIWNLRRVWSGGQTPVIPELSEAEAGRSL